MRIYHNIPALYAYNALNATNSGLQKSIRTLSTGLRINSAADDAAGLAISEKMRSQISGLQMATRNAQDGISMMQTAEGALTETHSILQRMRELSVQAANDTLTQQDRQFIQLEIDQLKDEISRIATTTQFNKKRLLDGSSAALWSSTELSTKAFVRGSLRQVDQFGQKEAFEGNYRITISATPGEAEAKKTDIFKIKHKNVMIDKYVNLSGDVLDMRIDNLPAGDYDVTGGSSSTGAVKLVGRYGYSSGNPELITDDVTPTANASVLLEVVNINTAAGTVTFRATADVLTMNGEVNTYVDSQMMLQKTETPTYTKLGMNMSLNAIDDVKAYEVGDKFTYNIVADGGTSSVKIQGTQNSAWGYRWGNPGNSVTYANQTLDFGLALTGIQGKDIHFRNFYINSANGTVYEGDVVVSFATGYNNGGQIGSFEAAYIGQVAESSVMLRDIDKFWNSQGVFMLNDPQTIVISQGDGKKTSVTLYSTDTVYELQRKLNDAIAYDLGQAQYAVRDANKFVTFVEEPTANTLESVRGTMIIRSMVAGNNGKFSFSGDQDLINALSLNVVQEAKENSFSVSVYDAHTGSSVANDVKVSGNLLVGVIHPNVDVQFDPMANVKVDWNNRTKSFDLTQQNEVYETILHLVDNSTVFQVGANEGEDVAVDIGNMSAEALGVTRVIVTDRDSASRAITILDDAISKVSAQRAKIGAYQNSMEHTVTNLTLTSTNLTDAESRIRDADMSMEMLNFTRLQILSQSGTAMLAQANQLPQSILSLIGG